MNKLAFSVALLCLAKGGAAWAQAVHGPRVEVLVGYESRAGDAGASANGGLTYGARLGYDVAVAPRLALGIDGEVAGVTNKGDQHFAVPTPASVIGFGIIVPPTTTDYTYRTRTGRNLYAGGRITFAATPALGVFALGGYANQRVSVCGFKSSLGGCDTGLAPVLVGPLAGSGQPTANFGATRDLGGFRLGGGMTMAMSKHLLASLEYRHTFYGNANVAPLLVPPLAITPPFGDTNQVVAAVGWRF